MTPDLTREDLQQKILDYLSQRTLPPPQHGIADFHAEVMKSAFPSEKGISQRTFSKRALFDEALDELIAEGFVETREGGRYYITEKGRSATD